MYSQRDEERYILDAFTDSEWWAPDRPSVLDIGAWDAKEFSNSRALIERGSSAVLVEPSPRPLENLLREYGTTANVQIVAACVGVSTDRWAELSVSADGVSTTEAANREQWKDAGGYYGKLVVPNVTLANLLDRFGGFDFVSIDTEGTSVDIALQLFATEMFPRCVCVEHDGRLVELGGAAAARGYKQVYVSTENAVFVK
jgi:FkbM family methyltransferase